MLLQRPFLYAKYAAITSAFRFFLPLASFDPTKTLIRIAQESGLSYSKRHRLGTREVNLR